MSGYLLPKSHYEHAMSFFKTQAMSYLHTGLVMPYSSLYDFLMKDGLEMCGPTPTYDQFYKALSMGMESTFTDNEMRQFVFEMNILYHFYNMCHSGEKIFYVTPNLAAKLANTSLNIDTHFLKSPCREIFVQLDPGLFQVRDIDGSMHPLSGFYVYVTDVGDAKEIRIMAVSLLKPTSKIAFNDSTFYFRLVLGPGKIQDLVHPYVAEQIVAQEENMKKFGGARNIEYLEEFTYFVFNTLLYITSKDADLINQLPVDYQQRIANVKSTRKRQKLEKRAGKAAGYIVIVAGSRIHDNDEDVKSINRAGSIGAWKLDKRVHVIGHWRGQWYGSSKDGTKRSEVIWINEYDKGPEFAETINKPYIVK